MVGSRRMSICEAYLLKLSSLGLSPFLREKLIERLRAEERKV